MAPVSHDPDGYSSKTARVSDNSAFLLRYKENKAVIHQDLKLTLTLEVQLNRVKPSSNS